MTGFQMPLQFPSQSKNVHNDIVSMTCNVTDLCNIFARTHSTKNLLKLSTFSFGREENVHKNGCLLKRSNEKVANESEEIE